MKKQNNNNQQNPRRGRWFKTMAVTAALAMAVVPSVLFSACGSKQPTTPTQPAHQHQLVKVELEYATTTHKGYLPHWECTGCKQWFYADGTYNYPEWMQINDGVVGIWGVTEASVEINQKGSSTSPVGSTITMTNTAYWDGAGTEKDRQNFWDNIFLSGNESIVFIQNGTCEGRRSGATWVQDDDGTITVTLADDKGTETYTVREDGSLTRTRRTAGGDVITYILYKGSNPL